MHTYSRYINICKYKLLYIQVITMQIINTYEETKNGHYAYNFYIHHCYSIHGFLKKMLKKSFNPKAILSCETITACRCIYSSRPPEKRGGSMIFIYVSTIPVLQINS